MRFMRLRPGLACPESFSQNLEGLRNQRQALQVRTMKRKTRKPAADVAQEHLQRVRQICAAMPESTEKLSHGEPTFFVRKKVFVVFANNHHNDGRIAVWIPTLPGDQGMLIKNSPEIF